MSVGGGDGELRPDAHDRDRARGPPGVEDLGGAKVPAAPGSPARKRMLPDRSRTTLSGMPSPLKSASNGVSVSTDAAGRHRLEGAVTFAQEHPDRAVVVADGDQVGPAVAVDIGHDGLDRREVGGEGLLTAKGSVAVVKQDAHVVAAVVGGDDVGLAVAGQVGRGHRVGPRADGVGLLRSECAVAVAHEHADGVARRVGGDDVGHAVAVQVGHGHGKRLLAGGERRSAARNSRGRCCRPGSRARSRCRWPSWRR